MSQSAVKPSSTGSTLRRTTASPSGPAIFLIVQSRVAGRFGRMFAQQLICLCSTASYLLRAFHIEIRPLAASYSVYLHVLPVHGCIGPGQPSKQSIHFEDEAPADDASTAVLQMVLTEPMRMLMIVCTSAVAR